MDVPRKSVFFFIIKPNRCPNYPNLLRHENIHVSGSSFAHHQEFIHCTFGSGICHTGLKKAFEKDQGGTEFHPGPARKLSTHLYDIRSMTIKFANLPLCACRGSTGQKPYYSLMTLIYQRFTAVLLLIYGSLFLSGIY